MTNDFVVREISLTEAKPVRLDVLRRGTPASEANYDGDHDPRTVHIGAERSGRVVATSTWLVMPWQGDLRQSPCNCGAWRCSMKCRIQA